MAAGLGFKDFVTGEVLTASDVDGYLMQGIWVFASAAARDSAVTSPQEGNFAYLKDTNTTTYYTGSAWTNLDTTGMVNPMTTTGDTIYSSSGSTPTRLGIGTAGQVLTVNSGATAPEWASASSGGMTLLSTTSLSGATTTVSGISGSYINLFILINGVTNATAGGRMRVAPNGTTNISTQTQIANSGMTSEANDTYIYLSGADFLIDETDADNTFTLEIFNYASASNYKNHNGTGLYAIDGYTNTQRAYFSAGGINTNSAITSLVFSNSGGNLSTGTVKIYGVK